MHDVVLQALVGAAFFAAVSALRHAFGGMVRGIIVNLQRLLPIDAVFTGRMLSHSFGVLEVYSTVWTGYARDLRQQGRDGEVIRVGQDTKLPFASTPVVHCGL